MRHGETEWSRSGRHTGLADIPLLPEGEQRARSLRPRLASVRFLAVYSSPLSRARETARLAGFADPTLEPLLVEWDYGDYNGITSQEIRGRRPGWDLWRDGCPNGEDAAAVIARARRFLDQALAKHEGSIIAFSHGHFLRALTVAFLNLDPSVGRQLNLETAALSVLRLDQEERLLELWNDIGHLPGSER